LKNRNNKEFLNKVDNYLGKHKDNRTSEHALIKRILSFPEKRVQMLLGSVAGLGSNKEVSAGDYAKAKGRFQKNRVGKEFEEPEGKTIEHMKAIKSKPVKKSKVIQEQKKNYVQEEASRKAMKKNLNRIRENENRGVIHKVDPSKLSSTYKKDKAKMIAEMRRNGINI